MTTKHEILIPILPDGYRLVSVNIKQNDRYRNDDGTSTIAGCDLIIEKIKPRRVVLEVTGRWHINSTEGYVLVPAGSLINMIDIEETRPDWMCYKVVEEE